GGGGGGGGAGPAGAARGGGERGRRPRRARSSTPPSSPRRAYDNAGGVGGGGETPADYDRLFRARYGLHEAPYPNGGLPMGLREAPQILLARKGLTTDCLLCHGGGVLGQGHAGLGPPPVGVQTLFLGGGRRRGGGGGGRVRSR